MSKINGSEATIKRVQDAKPGDPCVYINLEAISRLPDDTEAAIVEIEFDKDKDFTNLGTAAKPILYPSTKLMYTISDARGISEHSKPEIEILYEDVNISDMTMTPTPVIMKKKVGYIVKKTGYVMQDDGTPRSSGHAGIFNAWDECSKMWAKEEMYSEGYTKDPGKWEDGNKREWKYNTKWKRQNHFQEMLDNAFGQADTKSWLKVIRDLAGLLTGYTPEQLKEGKFYFVKIRRSEMMRKMETAARLTAIRNGGQPQLGTMQPQQIAAPEQTTPADDFTLEVEVMPAELSEREQLHKDLSEWRAKGLIPALQVKSVDNILIFLERSEPEKNAPKWEQAKKVVSQIREIIKEETRNIF
jgi:hypothetical protein